MGYLKHLWLLFTSKDYRSIALDHDLRYKYDGGAYDYKEILEQYIKSQEL